MQKSVAVIPIAAGALGAIPKGVNKSLQNRPR